MPRGVRKQSIVEDSEVVEKMEAVVEEEKAKASPWERLEPFAGVDKLPYAEVNSSGSPTKLFKQYYVSGRELIEVYRARHGQVRRICKYTFHPAKPEDKLRLKALRKRGIPGA